MSSATAAVREHPILFSGPMVKAILEGRKTRRKQYVRQGEDANAPEHLARRLANGLDVAEPNMCWVWRRAKNNAGYGTLTVRGRMQYAHRLAFELGTGQMIPVGMHVCHRCDNPACINPDHLFLGTRSDNMRDCVEKGRHVPSISPQPGESNPAAKLTEMAVEEIRRLLGVGMTQREIAYRFGVSQSAVSNINRGRSW